MRLNLRRITQNYYKEELFAYFMFAWGILLAIFLLVIMIWMCFV